MGTDYKYFCQRGQVVVGGAAGAEVKACIVSVVGCQVSGWYMHLVVVLLLTGTERWVYTPAD